MRKRAGWRIIEKNVFLFADELLDQLWVLEATVKLYPKLEQLLCEVLVGELFRADELPRPKPGERKPLSSAPMFESE